MITSVSAVKTDFGLAVVTQDDLGIRQPAMLSNQPVVNGTFRMCQLAEWANALSFAIRLVEENQHVLKPTNESEDALNELSYLQGKIEGLIEDGMRQHKEVTEKMSVTKPELMQEYLASFAAAVGNGEV